jgi:hypothetical protein
LIKRYAAILLLLCLPLVAMPQGVLRVHTNAGGGGGFTPFDTCFDFRATSGYVTDSAPCTYVLGTADTYPVSRGSAPAFGYVQLNNTVTGADRNNANDARLAGINFSSGFGGLAILSNTYFEVDLPSAGTYSIHLALGDSFNHSGDNMRVEIRDNTTSLSFVVSTSTNGANHYLDANGVDLTNVTWPGSETSKSAVFATTTLRMYIGDLTTNDPTTVAHLRITRTA